MMYRLLEPPFACRDDAEIYVRPGIRWIQRDSSSEVLFRFRTVPASSFELPAES